MTDTAFEAGEKVKITHPLARVEVAQTDSEMEALKAEWNELFAMSPAASPALRWTWVREWWKLYGPVYGDKGRGLRILAVRRGAQLIGILPLYEGYKTVAGLKIRRLTTITAGAQEFEETYTDYLDLLYAPGEEAACVEAIVQTLTASQLLRWEELHLPQMSHESKLAAIAPMFSRPRFSTEVSGTRHSHLFDMEGGFDGYLARISGENRRQGRKMLRDSDNEKLTFEVAADERQADAFFDQLIELHRDRWNSKGKSGSFAPRHSQFHRTMVLAGVDTGESVIARLMKGESPIAVIYGQRVNKTLFCFQQGVDTSVTRKLRSPGTAAWLMLMRDLAPKGLNKFDHMTGTTQFKERFATGTYPIVDVKIRRLGLRWASYAAADFSVRAVRKAVRVARGVLKKPQAVANGKAAGAPAAQNGSNGHSEGAGSDAGTDGPAGD